MSKLFTLNMNDFTKGLVTTFFAAILTVLYSVTQQPDFNLFFVDWAVVGGNVINVCVITMMSYLSKNFMTGTNGNLGQDA